MSKFEQGSSGGVSESGETPAKLKLKGMKVILEVYKGKGVKWRSISILGASKFYLQILVRVQRQKQWYRDDCPWVPNIQSYNRLTS